MKHFFIAIIITVTLSSCTEKKFVVDESLKDADTNPQQNTTSGSKSEDGLNIVQENFQDLDPATEALLNDGSLTDCDCEPGPKCDCRTADDQKDPNICIDIKGNEICTTIGDQAQDGAIPNDGTASNNSNAANPDGDSPGDNSSDSADNADGLDGAGGNDTPAADDSADQSTTDGGKSGSGSSKKLPPPETVEYLFAVTSKLPTVIEDYLIEPVAKVYNAATDSGDYSGNDGANAGFLVDIPLTLNCDLVQGILSKALPGEIVQINVVAEFHDKDGKITYRAIKTITLGTSRRLNIDYNREDYSEEDAAK